MDGKPFNLRYSLYIPQGYDKVKDTPLMVYLHGDDLRDTDQSTIFMHGSAMDPRREGKTAFPMIGLVPQLPHDKQWTDPKIVAMNEALLTEIATRLRVDAQRMYVVGHQSGAAGALAMASHNPARFAACVALQGVTPSQEETARRLKGMAVRLLAYVNDGGANSAAKQMADALAKAGVEADCAKIPEGKDAKDWLPFYTEPQLVKWLLDHRRPPQVTPTARAG
jgi:predicted peptidase